MSKTKWLCPFNKLIPCDDTCMVYGRNIGCGLLNDIDRASQAIDSIAEYMDESTGTIHRIGDALTQLAEETSPYDGGMQIREGLDSLGSSMPDMSDVADSINLLARVINPTEYGQHLHELSQRLMNEVKTHEQEWQDFSLFEGDDADSD